jgi:uncharacterized membrane protein YgdD (TMEM256/DUF423 family)
VETKLYLALAACLGAAGMMLLAAGSHAAPGNVTIAGQMLLFHAPTLMAAGVARDAGHLNGLVGRVAILGLAIGVVVFSGDLALRGFGHGRLFPMAAPIGGTLVIAGWIALAAAAAMAPGRERP